jgi:hypothetical protein
MLFSVLSQKINFLSLRAYELLNIHLEKFLKDKIHQIYPLEKFLNDKIHQIYLLEKFLKDNIHKIDPLKKFLKDKIH